MTVCVLVPGCAPTCIDVGNWQMTEPNANDMHFMKQERLSGIREKKPAFALVSMLNNSAILFSTDTYILA